MNQGEFDTNEIIGMEFYPAFVWAKLHGFSLRVIRKNGNDCLVSRDQLPNRINVATQDEVVTEILSFG